MWLGLKKGTYSLSTSNFKAYNFPSGFFVVFAHNIRTVQHQNYIVCENCKGVSITVVKLWALKQYNWNIMYTHFLARWYYTGFVLATCILNYNG